MYRGRTTKNKSVTYRLTVTPNCTSKGCWSLPIEKVWLSSLSTLHCSSSKAPIGCQINTQLILTPLLKKNVFNLSQKMLWQQAYWPLPHQSGNKRGSWRQVSLASSLQLQGHKREVRQTNSSLQQTQSSPAVAWSTQREICLISDADISCCAQIHETEVRLNDCPYRLLSWDLSSPVQLLSPRAGGSVTPAPSRWNASRTHTNTHRLDKQTDTRRYTDAKEDPQSKA